MTKRNIYKYLFFAWLFLIIIAASISQLPTPRIKTSSGSSIRFDYYIHILEFLILSILFFLWLANRNPQQIKKNFVIVFAISIVLAFIIEFYQNFVPGRKFNILDSIFNLIGLLIGIAIVAISKWTKK